MRKDKIQRIFLVTLIAMIAPLAAPQFANATCYGGCNYINNYLDNYFQENAEQFKGDKGDKGDTVIGPMGPQGEKGDNLQGLSGFAVRGVDGKSITGPRGYSIPPIGTSFFAAARSFDGTGFGVGLGGGNGTLEFSAVGGVDLNNFIKLVAGFTHMASKHSYIPDQNRWSVGVGMSI